MPTKIPSFRANELPQHGEARAIRVDFEDRPVTETTAGPGCSVEDTAGLGQGADGVDSFTVGVGHGDRVQCRLAEVHEDRVTGAVRVQLVHRAVTRIAAKIRRPVEHATGGGQAAGGVSSSAFKVFQHAVTRAINVDLEHRPGAKLTASIHRSKELAPRKDEITRRIDSIAGVKECEVFQYGVVHAVGFQLEDRSPAGCATIGGHSIERVTGDHQRGGRKRTITIGGDSGGKVDAEGTEMPQHGKTRTINIQLEHGACIRCPAIAGRPVERITR